MQWSLNVSPAYVMIVTSLVLSGVLAAMDQAGKDYILKVHNEDRGKEGASDMPALVWNSTLEQEAIAWAANCAFRHKGMGENLAWNSMTDKPANELVDTAMKGFYDEKLRYSYGQRSCGSSMACHYTQLAWAKTTQVGCASQVCQPLSGAYSKAWFLVCRYDPVGNWNGEKPFLKGAACSHCANEGATCEGGLCEGGTPKKAECKDDYDRCAGWARRNQCNENKGFMLKSCKKSCEVC